VPASYRRLLAPVWTAWTDGLDRHLFAFGPGLDGWTGIYSSSQFMPVHVCGFCVCICVSIHACPLMHDSLMHARLMHAERSSTKRFLLLRAYSTGENGIAALE
jgi:hypothetical protein